MGLTYITQAIFNYITIFLQIFHVHFIMIICISARNFFEK
jgi:hypothetical protein